LGSYGREQLCVYSDIDLMIVYKKCNGFNTKDIIENIIQIAWDCGLKLGHRVHEIEELFQVSNEDITIKSSLIESRFIYGSKILFNEVNFQLRKIREYNQKEYILAKLDEYNKRLEKHSICMEPNIKAFDRGYNEVVEKEFVYKGNEGYKSIKYKRPNPFWGYETAPMGGVILTPGNSALKDLSISRSGYIPLWSEDKCIHCALCEITCPDMAIIWRVEEIEGKRQYLMKGINYQYCKGCLKCVEICPTSALTKERDTEEIVKGRGLNYI